MNRNFKLTYLFVFINLLRKFEQTLISDVRQSQTMTIRPYVYTIAVPKQCGAKRKQNATGIM